MCRSYFSGVSYFSCCNIFTFRANAYRNAKAGRGPDLNLKPDEIAAIKAGGKSIDELTGKYSSFSSRTVL